MSTRTGIRIILAVIHDMEVAVGVSDHSPAVIETGCFPLTAEIRVNLMHVLRQEYNGEDGKK